jgi:Flavodoxins
MKLSIIYFSKSGHTKEMAEIIANGMKSIPEIEVGIFDLDHIDDEFLAESKAVVFGTPTYYANTCWQIKK